jgi:hypothetical protein
VPVEAWFFTFRGGGVAFEFEIFFEGNFMDHSGVFNGRSAET